jgi:hypothetical protein
VATGFGINMHYKKDKASVDKLKQKRDAFLKNLKVNQTQPEKQQIYYSSTGNADHTPTAIENNCIDSAYSSNQSNQQNEVSGTNSDEMSLVTFQNAKNFLERMTMSEEPISPSSPTKLKLATMIKIPKHVPADLQGTFFGEKEVRLLPPSIIKALSKRPRNVFATTPIQTDASTTWLDNDLQTDYMSGQFR